MPAENLPGNGGRNATDQGATNSSSLPEGGPRAATEQRSVANAPATKAPPVKAPDTNVHSFWDNENDWLFAGIGIVRALDYTSTANFRARGRQEILLTNWVVDNKPLFAGIEAATVGASIGVSYIFHRTGHHRLERWVSFVHIGVTGFGVVRNYSLQSARPHVRTASDGTGVE
jgi:hypothetical protein